MSTTTFLNVASNRKFAWTIGQQKIYTSTLASRRKKTFSGKIIFPETFALGLEEYGNLL